LKTPYSFFLSHAGYSYNPETQTPAQGRAQCAKALAQAEAKATEAGLRTIWAIDEDTNSLDFTDESYPLYRCCLVRGENEIVQSLHGVDFGPDVQPWGTPYARVLAAELALEHFRGLTK